MANTVKESHHEYVLPAIKEQCVESNIFFLALSTVLQECVFKTIIPPHTHTLFRMLLSINSCCLFCLKPFVTLGSYSLVFKRGQPAIAK